MSILFHDGVQCVPLTEYRELEAKLEEHERRWRWLNRSLLALSKEGYSEWASVVLALVNGCRYEPLEGE